MNSAIFLRRETYGRKCQLNVGSTGQRRHDASSIINEVFRVPSYAPHVASPTIITLIANGFRDARSLGRKVRKHAEAIRTTDSLGRRRPLHRATHTLCSDVVSTPVPIVATKEDSDLRARVMTFFQSALVWITDDIEGRGGQVLQAIIHLDEAHWHMHVLSIADCGFAKTLHPGFVAKQQAKENLANSSASQGEINALADQAYKSAMKQFLNRFHIEVGYRLELARKSDTPKPRESYADLKRKADADRDTTQQTQKRLIKEAEQAALRTAANAAQAAHDAHLIKCERLALDRERGKDALDREREQLALGYERARLEEKARQLDSRQDHLDDGCRENQVAEADLARRESKLAVRQSDLDARFDQITDILGRVATYPASPELQRLRKHLQNVDPDFLTFVDDLLAKWQRDVASQIRKAWTAPNVGNRRNDEAIQVVASPDRQAGETAWEAVLRRRREREARDGSQAIGAKPGPVAKASHADQTDTGSSSLSPFG